MKTKLQPLLKTRNTSFLIHNYSKYTITTSEIKSKEEYVYKTAFNPFTQKEEFDKHFGYKHKNWKYVEFLKKWIKLPYLIGWWNHNRDNDQANAAYNCGGAYPNKLTAVLFRSKVLQKPFLAKLAMKFLDRRSDIDYARSEIQPQITNNSVFIYKEPSTYIINRRGLERLVLAFFILQGINFSGLVMYTYIALFSGLLAKVIFTSRSLVIRLDLLPESEQLHIIKVGLFGLPRSVLVDIKSLERISFEADINYNNRWYKSIFWRPYEDKNLVYRNSLNGETYTFSRRGIWNKDGLEHKLLN